MADNQKISFVIHGRIHGKKKIIRELQTALSVDFELGFFETERARQAQSLTIEALELGCDFLIAIGGDGTLNEVVNGYLKSGGKEKHKAVLGVLPWGTGNDFVRTIGVERSVEQLSSLIRTASIRNIDAGKMLIGSPEEKREVSYFVNVADAGFGAEVVSEINGVHLRKKILGGAMTFILTIFFKFFTYKHKLMRISWEGFTWEGPVLALVVANGQFFGSGYGIAPDAQIDSGKFQVVLAGNVTMFDYFKNFGNLRKSKRINLPDLNYHFTDHVNVEALGEKVFVEADGEIHGSAPLRFECLPGVLPFLVPPTS